MSDGHYRIKSVKVLSIELDTEEKTFDEIACNMVVKAKINGLASYPEYTGATKELKVQVDNKQNITEGREIQTLDTNTSTPFQIRVLNDQLGLPKAAEGGFTLEDSIPGQSYLLNTIYYRPEVVAYIGKKETTSTGHIYDGTIDNQVNGDVSKDSYCGGHLKAALNVYSASLTYNGSEKLGNQVFTFDKNWFGGMFRFKTTKMADYWLTNNGAVYGLYHSMYAIWHEDMSKRVKL